MQYIIQLNSVSLAITQESWLLLCKIKILYMLLLVIIYIINTNIYSICIVHVSIYSSLDLLTSVK